MRSGNPALKQISKGRKATRGETMTIGGTLAKTFFLFLFLLGAASYSWMKFSKGEDITTMLFIGLFGGLAVGLILIFFPRTSPGLGVVYATLEGLAIGGVSAAVNAEFSQSVLIATVTTLAVFLTTGILYVTRFVKVTPSFISMIVAATFGVFIVYMSDLVLSAFLGINVPLIHESSTGGIIVSVITATIAALNLFVDFHSIEEFVEMGAPKYMEWYNAFGLMVTLVWLYLEILRLIMKLSAEVANNLGVDLSSVGDFFGGIFEFFGNIIGAIVEGLFSILGGGDGGGSDD